MKKVFLSFLVAATLFACTSKTTTAEKQIIGFDQPEDTQETLLALKL